MDRISSIASLFLVTSASFPLGVAYSQEAPRIEHIEIVVKPHGGNYPFPLPLLGKSSFQLRVQGTVIPVTLGRGGKDNPYPEYLLIVSSSPAISCTPQNSALLQHLADKGWKIRIGFADGTVTAPFENKDSWQTVCLGTRQTLSSPIAELEVQPGRRVVIFQSAPTPTELAAAKKTIPEVYRVGADASQPSSSPFTINGRDGPSGPVHAGPPENPFAQECYSMGSITSANDPCYAQGSIGSAPAFGYRRGILYEKSLLNALNDLLHVQGRYYDLAFQVLAPLANLPSTQLDLRFHTEERLFVTADLYSETVPAGGTQPVRSAAAGQLTSSQR